MEKLAPLGQIIYKTSLDFSLYINLLGSKQSLKPWSSSFENFEIRYFLLFFSLWLCSIQTKAKKRDVSPILDKVYKKLFCTTFYCLRKLIFMNDFDVHSLIF